MKRIIEAEVTDWKFKKVYKLSDYTVNFFTSFEKFDRIGTTSILEWKFVIDGDKHLAKLYSRFINILDLNSDIK